MCPSSFATAPDQLRTLPRLSVTRLQGCMPAKGNQEHFSVFLFFGGGGDGKFHPRKQVSGLLFVREKEVL